MNCWVLLFPFVLFEIYLELSKILGIFSSFIYLLWFFMKVFSYITHIFFISLFSFFLGEWLLWWSWLIGFIDDLDHTVLWLYIYRSFQLCCMSILCFYLYNLYYKSISYNVVVISLVFSLLIYVPWIYIVDISIVMEIVGRLSGLSLDYYLIVALVTFFITYHFSFWLVFSIILYGLCKYYDIRPKV